MPYKLKSMSSKTPPALQAKFNPHVANRYGIVFKNRVPVVNDFPECFDEIDEDKYTESIKRNYNLNQEFGKYLKEPVNYSEDPLD